MVGVACVLAQRAVRNHILMAASIEHRADYSTVSAAMNQSGKLMDRALYGTAVSLLRTVTYSQRQKMTRETLNRPPGLVHRLQTIEKFLEGAAQHVHLQAQSMLEQGRRLLSSSHEFDQACKIFESGLLCQSPDQNINAELTAELLAARRKRDKLVKARNKRIEGDCLLTAGLSAASASLHSQRVARSTPQLTR